MCCVSSKINGQRLILTHLDLFFNCKKKGREILNFSRNNIKLPKSAKGIQHQNSPSKHSILLEFEREMVYQNFMPKQVVFYWQSARRKIIWTAYPY